MPSAVEVSETSFVPCMSVSLQLLQWQTTDVSHALILTFLAAVSTLKSRTSACSSFVSANSLTTTRDHFLKHRKIVFFLILSCLKLKELGVYNLSTFLHVAR